MPQIASLNENPVDYEKLTEILLAHLEVQTSDEVFLVKDGVKIIL